MRPASRTFPGSFARPSGSESSPRGCPPTRPHERERSSRWSRLRACRHRRCRCRSCEGRATPERRPLVLVLDCLRYLSTRVPAGASRRTGRRCARSQWTWTIRGSVRAAPRLAQPDQAPAQRGSFLAAGRAVVGACGWLRFCQSSRAMGKTVVPPPTPHPRGPHRRCGHCEGQAALWLPLVQHRAILHGARWVGRSR